MRQCSKCKQNKDAEDFNKGRPECKECQKAYYQQNSEKIKECNKAYREQNREKIKAYRKQNAEKLKEQRKAYRKQNAEKIKEQSKAWYQQNREQMKAYMKAYRKQNRDKRRIYVRNRLKTDINFKIANNLRTRVRKVLKGERKSKNTMDLIGCSADFLKKHLENQFQPGMSWDNYGYNGWHVDHILPCASFDLGDPKQQQKCFHYTNLQPLWAKDNISKGAKIN